MTPTATRDRMTYLEHTCTVRAQSGRARRRRRSRKRKREPTATGVPHTAHRHTHSAIRTRASCERTDQALMRERATWYGTEHPCLTCECERLSARTASRSY